MERSRCQEDLVRRRNCWGLLSNSAEASEVRKRWRTTPVSLAQSFWGTEKSVPECVCGRELSF